MKHSLVCIGILILAAWVLNISSCAGTPASPESAIPKSNKAATNTAPKTPKPMIPMNPSRFSPNILIGQWKVTAQSTGKPALDQQLSQTVGDIYVFSQDGSGKLQTSQGSFPFSWKMDDRGLALRYEAEMFERYDQFQWQDNGELLKLSGRFDLDFDNQPDHILLTLRSFRPSRG